MRAPLPEIVYGEGDYIMLGIDAMPRPGRVRTLTPHGRYIVDVAGERIPYVVPAHQLSPLPDPEDNE